MPQWVGGPEFVLIVLVIVLLFGWKKLPDAARSLGRSMRIFKAEVHEMKHDQPAAGAGASASASAGASREAVREQRVVSAATDETPETGTAPRA